MTNLQQQVRINDIVTTVKNSVSLLELAKPSLEDINNKFNDINNKFNELGIKYYDFISFENINGKILSTLIDNCGIISDITDKINNFQQELNSYCDNLSEPESESLQDKYYELYNIVSVLDINLDEGDITLDDVIVLLEEAITLLSKINFD